MTHICTESSEENNENKKELSTTATSKNTPAIDLESKIRSLQETIMPKGTTESDLVFFIEYCKRTGLDPISRQIYAMAIGNKLSIQTSIDGFRLIASRSSEYAGQQSFWCGDDGIWVDVWLEATKPRASKVEVYRKGYAVPITAIALWNEYQRTNNHKTSIWDKMPALMLAKCAEALALRKAFPNELSGIYTSDEMAQANTTGRHENKNGIDYKLATGSKSKDEAGKQLFWEECDLAYLTTSYNFYSQNGSKAYVNAISKAISTVTAHGVQNYRKVSTSKIIVDVETENNNINTPTEEVYTSEEETFFNEAGNKASEKIVEGKKTSDVFGKDGTLLDDDDVPF